MAGWSARKVVELKDELKKRGLSTSGKKAELVLRLEEHDRREEKPEQQPVPDATQEPLAKRRKAVPTDAGIAHVPCTETVAVVRTMDIDTLKTNPAAAAPTADTRPEGLVASPSGTVDNNDNNDRHDDLHNDNEVNQADISDHHDEKVALADENRPVPITNDACPYLSTINRKLLDFDFEKACSISLSKVNVYACLVCGKYFTGRGPSTNAYTHSLQEGHHMFMRLDSGRTFCLPDNYEVHDPSLHDIQHVLNPTFSQEEISSIDDRGWSRDLEGREYMPGLVGLNNMKANDYANVVLQAMLRISPIRDFFLRRENYTRVSTPLLERFGELVRKTNNDRAFRGHVSPHDFMQSVVSKSENRFNMETQGDPVQFFSWLLNALHMDLTQGNRKQASIISDTLQGEIEVTTLAGTGIARKSDTNIVNRIPYLMLTLDLPPAPLFKDAMEKIVIPQIPIGDLLTKFDGVSIQDDVRLGRRKMRLLSLPRFLVVSVKRFLKNQFFMEKNPTIVNFPAKGLEMQSAGGTVSYDLIANIMHEGNAKEAQGAFKVHIQRKSEGSWYEVQDLTLKDVLPQVVVLSETTLLVYERGENNM